MVFLKHRGFLFSELSKGCAAPTLAAFEDGPAEVLFIYYLL